MSISERTKEIGIMKSLGCYVRDIRTMFLMEAGAIGFLGDYSHLIDAADLDQYRAVDRFFLHLPAAFPVNAGHQVLEGVQIHDDALIGFLTFAPEGHNTIDIWGQDTNGSAPDPYFKVLETPITLEATIESSGKKLTDTCQPTGILKEAPWNP